MYLFVHRSRNRCQLSLQSMLIYRTHRTVSSLRMMLRRVPYFLSSNRIQYICWFSTYVKKADFDLTIDFATVCQNQKIKDRVYYVVLCNLIREEEALSSCENFNYGISKWTYIYFWAYKMLLRNLSRIWDVAAYTHSRDNPAQIDAKKEHYLFKSSRLSNTDKWIRPVSWSGSKTTTYPQRRYISKYEKLEPLENNQFTSCCTIPKQIRFHTYSLASHLLQLEASM